MYCSRSRRSSAGDFEYSVSRQSSVLLTRPPFTTFLPTLAYSPNSCNIYYNIPMIENWAI